MATGGRNPMKFFSRRRSRSRSTAGILDQDSTLTSTQTVGSHGHSNANGSNTSNTFSGNSRAPIQIHIPQNTPTSITEGEQVNNFPSRGRQLSLPGSSLQFHQREHSQTSYSIRTHSPSIQGSSGSAPAFPGNLDLTVIHEPASRNLDIIFVHGLGGGSRKTWSYNKNPNIFWPEWVPQIPQLNRARISTFGYDASVLGASKVSDVNVETFARRMLHCLSVHGTQNRDMFGMVPIIFICHSMGGLVVKRACVKADKDPALKNLSANISGAIFLGTPHRGSPQAKKLRSVLKFFGRGGQDKEYIKDIMINSGFLQMLNDDFRHLSTRMKLFSFYEQLKTSIGSMEMMIVEQASAVLGYAQEESAPLYANHHLVCKFSSPADTNYITVTQTLVGMADKILEEINVTTPGDRKRHVEEIYKFLQSPDLTSTEADLCAIQSKRVEGSCQWITKNPFFIGWQQTGICIYSEILWIHGVPGTGKSVIAASIIDEIRRNGSSCYYYFFKSADVSKQSLDRCLLLIAYQISLEDRSVREEILKLHGTKFRVVGAELLLLWQKIFITLILPIYVRNGLPLYLVIDALDEAQYATEIFPLLKALRSLPSLRLCITSRPNSEFAKEFAVLSKSIKVSTHSVSATDTMEDISKMVEKALSTLPLGENMHIKPQIVETVISKSEGNFLWASLVSKQIMNEGFNKESVLRVLGEIPPGMDQVYEEVLEKMQHFQPQKRELARWMIQWTLGSFQPLTLVQLKEALSFQPPAANISQLGYWITELCGSFLVVDARDTVQPIHTTAREFLLGTSFSEYAITTDTHTHIAKACIATLQKSPMADYAARKMSFSAQNDSLTDVSRLNSYPLRVYAAQWWSAHLKLSRGDDTDLFNLINGLMNSRRFLDCIKQLAEMEGADLISMIRMAKNLKSYLETLDTQIIEDKRDDIRLLSLWTVDLIRLSTEFGDNLREFPSSIEKNMIPFCPTNSAIYRCFSKRDNRLVLLGDTLKNWDTRLGCLTRANSNPSTATAVASSSKLAAVGHQDGTISLWNSLSCQMVNELDLEGNSILSLAFNNKGSIIAAGCRNLVMLWNTSTAVEVLSISFKDHAEPFSIIFSADDAFIIVILRNNIMQVYDLEEGTKVNEFNWSAEDKDLISSFPLYACLDSTQTRMALAYRGKPVSIWDVEQKSIIKRFKPSCSTPSHQRVHEERGFTNFTHDSASAIEFSTVTSELFISFSDGTFLKWDPDHDKQTPASRHSDVHVMRCSPDGAIIATGNYGGQISLWATATMELLHLLNEDDEGVKRIEFSPDGRRIFDIRSVYCNVWQPEVLMRGAEMYQKTQSLSPIAAASGTFSHTFEQQMSITCIAPSANREFILAGTDNGKILLYSMYTGKKLFEQKYACPSSSSEITCIAWGNEGEMIAIGNNTSGIAVRRLIISNRTGKKPPPPNNPYYQDGNSDSTFSGGDEDPTHSKISVTTALVLKASVRVDGRLGGAITSMLIDKTNTLLAVSTRSSDTIWKLDPAPPLAKGQSANCLVNIYEYQKTRHILQHPTDRDLIMLVDSDAVRFRRWSSIEQQISKLNETENASSPAYLAPETNSYYALTAIRRDRTEEEWKRTHTDQVEVDAALVSNTSSNKTQCLFTCISAPRSNEGPGRQTEIWVWKLPEDILEPNDSSLPRLVPVCSIGVSSSATRIQAMLGVDAMKFYFLDSRGWVCSKDYETMLNTPHAQNIDHLHEFDMWFFFPRGQVIPAMSSTISQFLISGKSVIYTKKDKLVIIKKGLRGKPTTITN